MPVSMEINLNNVDKRLREMASKIGDFQTPFAQAGVQMEKNIGKRFQSNSWKPLSEATLKRHPHRVGGSPLRDTGRLEASVTSKATKDLGKDTMKYGTNLKQAPLHNFGGSSPFGYIPQREFLFFDSNDEKAIQRIFEDYIKKMVV